MRVVGLPVEAKEIFHTSNGTKEDKAPMVGLLLMHGALGEVFFVAAFQF